MLASEAHPVFTHNQQRRKQDHNFRFSANRPRRSIRQRQHSIASTPQSQIDRIFLQSPHCCLLTAPIHHNGQKATPVQQAARPSAITPPRSPPHTTNLATSSNLRSSPRSAVLEAILGRCTCCGRCGFEIEIRVYEYGWVEDFRVSSICHHRHWSRM